MSTVSAVIPTYNRLAYVRRALRSVLRQPRQVDEVILVDDGSTDGTARAVRSEFGSAVTVLEQSNGGVSKARLAGVTHARGEWIAFLDSDDEWAPNRTELLHRAASELPLDVAWIFGDTLVVTDSTRTSFFGEYGLRVQGPVQVYDDPLPTQYPIQYSLMPSSMVRRSALLQVGAFTHNLRSSEDLLAGWQVAARYRMAAVPEVVTHVHREAELAASSIDRSGRQSPDYHRARVIGYSTLARSNRPGLWGRLHSDSVRRLCLRTADSDPSPKGLRRLALQQFRHSLNARAVLFLGAALCGRPGLRAWKWAVGRRDQVLPSRPTIPSMLTHEDSEPEMANVGHD